jgi:hypothetical protein
MCVDASAAEGKYYPSLPRFLLPRRSGTDASGARGCFPHFHRSLMSDASPQLHQGIFHPSLIRSHSHLSDGVAPMYLHRCSTRGYFADQSPLPPVRRLSANALGYPCSHSSCSLQSDDDRFQCISYFTYPRLLHTLPSDASPPMHQSGKLAMYQVKN